MSLSPQKVDFEQVWAGLQDGVSKIVTLTGVSGMPMMEDIYKLCTAQPQPYSEELYLRFKSFIERHVDSLREEILAQQSDLLEDYLKKWEAYSTGTEFCHHIFRYLNNNWIRKRLEDSRNKLGGLYQGPGATAEVFEIATLCLVVWRDHVFSRTKGRLVEAVLDLFTKERDGEVINSRVLIGIIQSFVKLGAINKNKPLEIYKDEFETAFLESTAEYYSRESAAFISSNGVSSYMQKAVARIQEEAARGKKYLDANSHEKLKKTVDDALIDRHKDILQTECATYLKDEKRDDLSRMYHLLSRITDGIKPMLEVLQDYITRYGFDAVKGIPAPETPEKEPVNYIETLLDVYRRFSDVVEKAFDQDPAFVAALDKAMRTIVNDNPINKPPTKSPELLAKYSNVLLCKSNRTFELDKADETLSPVLIIFKYVDDKDVFQKFYSKMLAKRLIHGTSISDDAESAMIGGLKQACGYEYTSKLQRMFNDMSLSGDLNEKYQQSLKSDKQIPKPAVDFSVQVLTAGSWPTTGAGAATFNMPSELASCVKSFACFYDSQHHGRKLTWLHHMCKGDLRTGYLKKRYEFVQVTDYQMSILLMFNGHENATIADLTTVTSLPDRDLKRALVPLIQSKILVKEPRAKALAPTDVVTLNVKFQSKRLRCKIPNALQKETKEENKETHQHITEERTLFLQAAIVRIMKARKTLAHHTLVSETISQATSRFQPHVPMIKKCIESLIEKEYLKRHDNETNTYSYVA
eukprot:TRINITY_DN5286_c0_g1_i1.p1 TRINITY_DN5286_c0_g1~~TRINITY_DN5286_c0_g1_i1.p1  ORF type:complete len:750 (+),score=121.38 TRINITY_DN5286_c0_g1_i1:207-2456(+)